MTNLCFIFRALVWAAANLSGRVPSLSVSLPSLLCAVLGATPRSAARSTGWNTESSGAPSASGRRPAHVSARPPDIGRREAAAAAMLTTATATRREKDERNEE